MNFECNNGAIPGCNLSPYTFRQSRNFTIRTTQHTGIPGGGTINRPSKFCTLLRVYNIGGDVWLDRPTTLAKFPGLNQYDKMIFDSMFNTFGANFGSGDGAFWQDLPGQIYSTLNVTGEGLIDSFGGTYMCLWMDFSALYVPCQ